LRLDNSEINQDNGSPDDAFKYAGVVGWIGDNVKVELSVDGKRVPMNKFVQNIVGSTIKGMIETLDDVGAWKNLEIKIESGKD